MKRCIALTLLLATAPASAARLKELADIEGVRSNALVGLGLVVGLHGTGDDIMSSAVSRHELAQLTKHLGVIVDAKDIVAKNVAAVALTAELPPFARAGMRIDVVVSSMGGAKSLSGGTLLTAELHGADREVYALAQGALTLGGFAVEGGSGSTAKKNHVTVGRVPGGARVERSAPGELPKDEVVLVLRDPDFTTATRVVAAINEKIGGDAAHVRDPAAIEVTIGAAWRGKTVELIATLEAIEAAPDTPGRVIIDERTGTIVVGGNVGLLPAAIAHGGLTVKVAEVKAVSQPAPLSPGGQTTVTPESQVEVDEEKGQLIAIPAAATVADVAAALNLLGAKPRDLVSIFQALKAAGALRAEIDLM